MTDENSQNDDSKPVSINEACIGCGICATMAPDIFVMNSEIGKSEITSDADLSSEENLTKAKSVAEACPVSAIETKPAK